MELNNLKIAKGSRHLPKRVGQGIGSGMGKTSTRGQKGQGARQGRKVPVGFEGGQLPLYRRVPKHGFVNYGRVEFETVKLAALAEILKDESFKKVFGEDNVIDDLFLMQLGLIRNLNKPVKVLGGCEIDVKLTLKVQAYTASAKKAIEAAGGTCEVETLKQARINLKALNNAASDEAVAEEK